MRILGISAFYHDSAAALIEDGKIRAAAQEERFTRKKHDSAFPANAVAWCLREAGINLSDVDYVAFYEKPFLKFERLLETYLAMAPRGFASFRLAVPLWIRQKLFQKKLLEAELRAFDPDFDAESRLLFSEHHLSHAASAFYPSPFEEAAVLTMDGVGEWTTTSYAVGSGSGLTLKKELHFPHSLGLLYSAFTYYTGFKVNSGEYKLMGLAPYGKPRYAQKILDHLIDLKEDGTFRLDQNYFNYCTGLSMTSRKFHALFEGRPRKADEPLTQRHMDLAASIQQVTEEAVLRLCRGIARESGMGNLCLAGGVALNCVANGKILKDGGFKKIWIQPAAGDAGGALGAALAAQHLFFEKPRAVDAGAMRGGYLGPSYAQADIERLLAEEGARFTVAASDEDLVEETASLLSAGKIVGWFQGRMEFGPRALGARSILGDPRSPSMQKVMNLKIKFRESFRPFAPSVLAGDVSEWFDLEGESPYMMLVANVAEKHRRKMSAEEESLWGIEKLNAVRSDIPAVTHVDYSARIQTVHEETNPLYHALLSRFKAKTGCPVLVNTSFNVRGEPMVGSPADAFRCFMGTDIDTLVAGRCILYKEKQDNALARDYKHAFQPD